MTTPPDANPYIDLTMFDLQPEDLVDGAVALGQTALPDWDPREGNVELVVFEGLALLEAEEVYAINRLPSAIFRGTLQLFGILVDTGAPPACTVQFVVGDSLGHDVPAGTRVALPAGGEGLDDLIFATDVALAIAPGDTAGIVAATATVNTSLANGASAGTVLTVLDAIAFVDRAALASDVAGGRSQETDDVYFNRAKARLARLTETLVLPDQFTARALEQPGVGRATTIDNYDGVGGSMGSDPGHVTVAVLDPAGAALSGGDKTDLEALLEAAAMATLDVHVIDPTITAVAVTATVKALAGWDPADVQALCESALTDYLSPQTWAWAGTVYRFELVALLDRVPGVDRVVSVGTPAADVALTGAAPLADAGTLTITVT